MIKNKQVAIVLGAAGFVGRHTARVLAARGYKVLGLGHGQWDKSEWGKWGLSEWLDDDICIKSLDRISKNIDPVCIIHCGGSGTVSFSMSNPLEDFQRATYSCAQSLEWIRLRANSDCRFVLVSSAAVYGDTLDSDASEKSARRPISPYGIHKIAAEALCESYSKFFGVSSSIVRLFSVYGDGLRKQLLWDALNKFKNGQSKFFGSGNEIRDWIHIDDAAELLALAGLTRQPIFASYNGGFEKATTKKLLNMLAMIYGYKQDIIFTGETHNGNPLRLTSDYSFATKSLSWKPKVCLLNGLNRYVSWFKKLPDDHFKRQI